MQSSISPFVTSRAPSNGLSDLDVAVEQPSEWLTQALSVPREEGYVDVDGCKLHYFRWGDASKPGLLLLHGFLAHARCFAFIAPFLANDYHIVAYDHSGMGDSDMRDAYPEEVRIEELMGVAQATGLFEHEQKPTLIAHSYGGHVATDAMHVHAGRFDGLIILDLMIFRPSYLKENAQQMAPPGNGNASRKNKVYPDLESAKQRFRLSPAQSVGHAELFDYMAFHSLEEVEGGWSWKFDPGVFKRDDKIENKWLATGAAVVQAPGRKVLVHGEQSKLFVQDSIDYLHELVEELGAPSFPIVGVPYAAHHLMLDQPIALVTILRTILADWAIPNN